MVAIVGPGTDTNADGIADVPGQLRARVKYSAFGVPTFVHPLDLDGDGNIGGGTEYMQDLAALTEAQDNAEASRGRANLGNVATISCFTAPCYETQAEWNAWRQQQLTHFGQNYPINAPLDLRAAFRNLPLYTGYWWDPHQRRPWPPYPRRPATTAATGTWTAGPPTCTAKTTCGV
ncbi:MAG: hypothetical protein U0637_06335 [Phycisphaerales bacterium]